VNVSDARFQELNRAVPLDRFVEPAGFAHWSFDEPRGEVFGVESSGSRPDASAVQVQTSSSARSTSGAAHADGRWQGALRFDGRLYAKAAFPGISDSVPHTVSFWVRVPADANLGSAYAMLGWGVNDPKLGSHPFHITWNRMPGDGIVGALRTDYGGGFAVGATSLRDGRWHHVAVVFIPRDDAERPMEVKQYVDGRLEGEGRPSPSGSEVFRYSAQDTAAAAAANGTVWLGCRLRVKGEGVRTDRFTGDIDELFIADRALGPDEIVRLMNNNQL
jgi:hypothetical protein